jgi:leader peptidase (prepilin peptidase)/N-methyltransferase
MTFLLVALLGLALGSFSTALIYRAPRDLPWAGASRSLCPQCGKMLGAADLVPVFSWLFSGGKCRHCHQKIDASYPLTEIGVAVACLCVYGTLGLTPGAVLLIVCVPFLTALLVIDLQRMILPTRLTVIVGALGLVRLAAMTFYENAITPREAVVEYLAAGLIYGGASWALGMAMTKILKKDALGMGDVKFFAAAGLWLGLSNLGLFCIISGVAGIILGLLWKFTRKSAVFPFGPALIAAFYLLLIFERHS